MIPLKFLYKILLQYRTTWEPPVPSHKTVLHLEMSSPSFKLQRRVECSARLLHNFFLWSAPVAFRRVALETPEWTSRDSNHHRQSVSAGKTNAIPTEPSGRLLDFSTTVLHTEISSHSSKPSRRVEYSARLLS